MEDDFDEPGLGVSDVIAPPARRNTDHKSLARITDPTHPLPAGYRLPFFAPFCYSPYATSLLAQRSRRLRDQVKRADPTTLAHCTARVATMIHSQVAPEFLPPDVALVPVPRCIPCDPRNPISSPEASPVRSTTPVSAGPFGQHYAVGAPSRNRRGRAPARGLNFSTTTPRSSSSITNYQRPDSFWSTTS